MTKVWTVADATQLKNAFKAAGDGDRIELAAGAVISEGTRLRDRDFAEGLTITSADPYDPALFTAGLELMEVTGVTLTDIDMERQAYTSSTGGLLSIRGSEDITVRDVSLTGYVPDESDGVDPLDPDTRKGDPIVGYGTGFGMRVISSSDIHLDSVAMADFKTVARIEQSRDLLLQDLDVTGSRDGIAFMATERMTITGSHFHDFNPWWNGDPKINDHADMIQYMGRHQASGIDDIFITGNLFDQGTGWTQTIYGDMAGRQNTSVLAEGVHVTDNVIINGHRNGIHLRNAVDPVIDNNLILSNVPDSEDFKRFPRIDVSAATGATIDGNVIVGEILTGEDGAGGHVLIDNIDLSIPPGSDAYWRPVYDAWQVRDGVALGDDYSAWAQQILGGTETGTGETDTDAGGGGTVGVAAGSATVSQSGPDQWHSVSFGQAIADARVVMGPVGGNEADPVVARVRNVTDSGFEFQLDEWDYLDGVHATETVSWLAGSAGTHALSDGRVVSFGRTTLQDDAAGQVTLAGFDAAPAVFAQVTSANDPAAVTQRLQAVSAGGFSVRLQEEEAADQLHGAETLDWAAIEKGTGGGLDAFQFYKGIDDGLQTVGFNAADGAGTAFLAAMQEEAGWNTAAVRLAAQRETEADLFLQEERSADSETNHKPTPVAYLAATDGMIELADGSAASPSLSLAFASDGPSGSGGWDDADGSGDLTAGDVLTYSYMLTNAGDAALTDVTLADSAAAWLDASALSGLTDADGDGAADDLAVGATATAARSYTVQAGDAGDVLSATATAGAAEVSAQSVTRTETVAEAPETGETDTDAGGGGTVGVAAGSATVSQSGPDQWHSVSFGQAIADARVVMGPVGGNEADPVVARVRNVTDSGFEFQLDEWDYLDGVHATETVSWLAGSAGTHALSDGRVVSFGRTTLQDDAAGQVTLAGFDAAPAVFAQVTSANDPAAVTQRLQAVSSGGFSVRLQEEEAADQLHGAETLDWAAIEKGTGGGLDAFQFYKGIDDGLQTVGFNAADGAGTAFLAAMQEEAGWNTAAVRLAAQRETEADLFLQEERSADGETNHKPTPVAYLAATDGMIDLIA